MTAERRYASAGAAVATIIGAPVSMLGLVGTQAMHGTETMFELARFFAGIFVLPYGAVAAIALLPLLRQPGGVRPWAAITGAFIAGGIVSAGVGTALMSGYGDHGLYLFNLPAVLLPPPVAGWLSVYVATKSSGPPTVDH